MQRGRSPLKAMTSSKGDRKFKVAHAMVSFCAVIIAANIPLVRLQSSPILISPFFKLRISSTVNFAEIDSFFGISSLVLRG